jgi:Fe-Mn family superoxide dismutase
MPQGALRDAIAASYGSFEALKNLFVAEGAAHFGSGWVWLVATNGKVEVVSTHDAAVPWLGTGSKPLLVCDVWEHAYYLDYKNERERFLRAWVDRLANWDFAAIQLAAATRSDAGYRFTARAGVTA